MNPLIRSLSSGRMTRSGSLLFLFESAKSGLTILSGFIIARFSSVADFGVFTAVLAFASILAIGVDAGMGMLAAKEVARAGKPGPSSRLNQIFTWRLWVITAACVL